jgi:hypothetical protein
LTRSPAMAGSYRAPFKTCPRRWKCALQEPAIAGYPLRDPGSQPLTLRFEYDSADNPYLFIKS